MSSHDKYHPNYKELYPGIQNRPEILDTLKKSDRKMEYMEVDLKRGTFIYDGEKQIAKFIPSREDSYDQMVSEDVQFVADETSVEMIVIRRIQIQKLRQVLPLLEPEEYAMVNKVFFEGTSVRKLAKQSDIPHMTLQNRLNRILEKLKIMMEG